MTILIPSPQGGFECISATLLPEIRVPSGTAEMCKIYPGRYFDLWSHHPDPHSRVDLSGGFRGEVLSSLGEVLLGDIPKQAVYVWRMQTPLAWSDVYRLFPRYQGPGKKPQVVPYYRLRDLALGWADMQQPLVPMNDVGVLLRLGNAGISQPGPTPGAPNQVGQVSRLVQLSHYVAVNTRRWNLSLPKKESDGGHLCPENMLFVTVW